MFDNIENLKIISTLHRTSKPYVKVEDRKTHSFFLRTQGNVLYEFHNKKILAKEGELIFIPKHSSYKAKVLTETSVYTSIHFEADFATKLKPACFSLEDFYEADYIKNCFSDMWNFGTQPEKYRCFSVFYNLLSYLSNIENTTHFEKNKFEIISPAVEYLREHIYDSDLKIEKLHRLCGVSNTYFRSIFISRFGVTPQNYIASKRISHAKAIIRSGDFNTISEVALAAGFNDALYFSRVFKKMCGVSPSQINKV